MQLFLTAGRSLEERLASGESVICAEGYLLALARRGYISHGVFIPDVVLENPEMVKLLHYEFAHCGSDVMEAFQVIIRVSNFQTLTVYWKVRKIKRAHTAYSSSLSRRGVIVCSISARLYCKQ